MSVAVSLIRTDHNVPHDCVEVAADARCHPSETLNHPFCEGLSTKSFVHSSLWFELRVVEWSIVEYMDIAAIISVDRPIYG